MINPADLPLKRSLSLSLLTFYGLGTILGAGIYVLIGKVAGYAGMYTLLAFLLASIVAGFSAFSYAELSVRYPKSAGEAVYVQHGFGRRHLSILVGLLLVFMASVSTATLVHGFVGYLKVFVQWPDVPVIVGVILIMLAIVIWGISESVTIAALMTVVEIAGLVLILWVAREGLAILPERMGELLPPLQGEVWIGILLGAFVAFYAFIGFEDIVNVAEEVCEPQRNLPRAIILALLITTLFYILVALVSILVMSPSELAGSEAPLALLYERMTGRHPTVITVISLVSVLNGVLIQVIMASRILYGMSREGWLPRHVGRVHALTRTPVVSILLVGSLIMLFALMLPLLSLAKLTSFITLTVFSFINLSLWRIKSRDDTPPSGFRVPRWVPVFGFMSCVGLLLFQISYLFHE